MLKVPHLHLPNWSNIAKELLLTFVGTTLSIVLTFGTALYLDKKQQRADGRQTAMMLIHDMENSAEKFEQYAQKEEERYKATQYVIENSDHLDAISSDTLREAYFYITQYTRTALYQYDDANEKLYLSEQDVWKNIDNASFLDVAQRFFYWRRTCYETLNADDDFRKPISYDELIDYCNSSANIGFSYVKFLTPRIKRPEVTSYINGFHARVRELTSNATTMREFAKRCKFLMDISDDELASYLQHRKHGGHALKKRKLIGQWTARDDMNTTNLTEFKIDNTMQTTAIQHVAHPYYLGRVDISFTSSGTWQIKGDSLIMWVSNYYEYSIDSTHIHILPDKQQEVRELFAKWENLLQEEQAKCSPDSIERDAWAAFMDASGRKIEAWRTNAPDPSSSSSSSSSDSSSPSESIFYLIKK